MKGSDIKNSRILIVDDDTFTRKVVRRVLSNLGYFSVFEAHNGEKALQDMRKNHIDLVITDIEMPKRNGVELVKAVRSGEAGVNRDARIIILTSYSNTEVIKMSLALDVNGFLVKPIKPVTTNEKVIGALNEPFTLKNAEEYAAVSTVLECLPSERDRDHVSAAILKEGGANNEFYVRLPYSQLKPGMSLRQDVVTRDDKVLLKEGHVLNVLMINRLQEIQDMLQFEAVWVFNPPDSEQ